MPRCLFFRSRPARRNTRSSTRTTTGKISARWRYELNLVGGVIVILFGLFMMGAARLSAMERDLRLNLNLPGGQSVVSYILGLAFGFGWTPCIGPILGAILTASAASATIGEGVAMLAVYSVGLGIPFLLVAVFTDRLAHRLRRLRQIGRWLHKVAGAVMVVTGILMATNSLSALSYWMLGVFPALGRLG